MVQFRPVPSRACKAFRQPQAATQQARRLSTQVMALNIGAALWLAASGQGRLRCRPDGPSGARDMTPYQSELCSARNSARRRATFYLAAVHAVRWRWVPASAIFLQGIT